MVLPKIFQKDSMFHRVINNVYVGLQRRLTRRVVGFKTPWTVHAHLHLINLVTCYFAM